MANTRTLYKTGSGTVSGTTTAVITASTTSKVDVSLVTIPSDPSYEYELYVSGYATWIASSATSCGASGVVVLPNNFYRCSLGANAGYYNPTVYVGASGATTASNTQTQTKDSNPFTSTSNIGETDTFSNSHKIQVIPGQSVVLNLIFVNETVTALASAASTGPYYFQYMYIGRKTITESF